MPEPDRAPRAVVFVDTEYTNLDLSVADLVEVAFAEEDDQITTGVPPHTLVGADAKALEINRYHERDLGNKANWDRSAVDYLAHITRGQTLVGANPRVDATILAKRIGYEPWHHRLGDIESMAWLLLGFRQIPGLRQIRDRLTELGFDIPEPDHSAAGDVEVTRACFRVLQRMARYHLRSGAPTAALLDGFEGGEDKIESNRS